MSCAVYSSRNNAVPPSFTYPHTQTAHVIYTFFILFKRRFGVACCCWLHSLVMVLMMMMMMMATEVMNVLLNKSTRNIGRANRKVTWKHQCQHRTNKKWCPSRCRTTINHRLVCYYTVNKSNLVVAHVTYIGESTRIVYTFTATLCAVRTRSCTSISVLASHSHYEQSTQKAAFKRKS